MATKEQVYIAKLESLGIYDPAFDAAIHQLCILERELSRAMKQWKATVPKGEAPLVTNPVYQVIGQLRRDIRASRDELGLTPKALKRLKGGLDFKVEDDKPQETVLTLVQKRHAG